MATAASTQNSVTEKAKLQRERQAVVWGTSSRVLFSSPSYYMTKDLNFIIDLPVYYA